MEHTHEFYITYILRNSDPEDFIGIRYTCIECDVITQSHEEDIGQKVGDKMITSS